MGRNNFLGPEQFVQVQAFQTELWARYPTTPRFDSLFLRGIRLQRTRGEETICLGSEKLFQGLGARNKAAHARQAKGSFRGQMTYSESGLCLAEAVGISLGDHVRG